MSKFKGHWPFIQLRSFFSRISFNPLMSYCWVELAPIIIAFIVIVPCLIIGL